MVAKDDFTDDPALVDDDAFSELLLRLTRTPWQIAIVVAGGGSGAIAKCLRRPGASKNFVEVVVPYAHEAMVDYLGAAAPAGYADRATATQLASVAMRRVRRLGVGNASTAVGIALVAALPTEPPRDHVDRIRVTIATENRRQTWSRHLTDRVYTRDLAESIADAMVFTALESLVEQDNGFGLF